MKLLSYVSICKLFVISFILILSMSYASYEYKRRRPTYEDNANARQKSYDFHDEFPAWPAVLGIMKAIGSMQAGYLFHIGIGDMYFSLKKRTYKKWANISRIACVLIGLVNLGYAVVGFLATSDLQMDHNSDINAKDLCRNSKEIFLSLYENRPAIKLAQSLLLAFLVSSYPLLFFFLRENVLILFRNIFPLFYTTKSELWWRICATALLWTAILLFALITEDPFSIINFQCTIFGTVLVFLLPGFVWIQAFGGFPYIFSLGYFSAKPMTVIYAAENSELCVSNSKMKKGTKTGAYGEEKNTTIVENKDIPETIELPVVTSIMEMLSAQFIFITGVIVMVLGCIVSLYGFVVEIEWRQNSF